MAVHSFSRKHLPTTQPGEWLADCVQAFVRERDSLKSLILIGAAIPSRYPVGWSLKMVDEHFAQRMDEADALSALNLVAATEAALRIDFGNRASRRVKAGAALNADFRARLVNWPRIALEADILNVWLHHYPALAARIAHFKLALQTRHWLAHGRWSTFKRGAVMDFATVALAVSDLEAALATSPASFYPSPV